MSFAVGPEAVTHVYLLVYGVTHDGILVADSKVFITNRDNAVEVSNEIL